MTAIVTLNAGASELARIVERSSVAHVARRLERDEASVRGWLAGKIPSTRSRKKIFEALGIAVELWSIDAAPESQPLAPESSDDVDDDEPVHSALEETRALVKHAKATANAAIADPNTTSRDRAAVLQMLRASLQQLNKLEKPNEKWLVTLPALKNVRDTILAALRPYPDALRAVSDAFQKFESGDAP